MRGERLRQCGVASLLLLAGIAVGLRTLGRPLGLFDEAIFLVGAERVLQGEVPYRDFYALYPPGQVYTTAALFVLFAPNAITLRLYCILVRSAIALLLYLIARRAAGGAAALGAWFGAILWTASSGNFGYPTFPALALVLVAVLLLQISVTAAARDPGGAAGWRLAAAGAALGAAALFRHDLGAYGLVAAMPLLLGPAVFRGASSGGGGRSGTASPWRPLLLFAGGVAVAFFLPAAWLLARAPWSEIRFELFTFPFETYSSVRSLPYPPLFAGSLSLATFLSPGALAAATPGFPFAVPLAVHSAALLWAAVRMARAPRSEGGRPELLGLASLALLGLLAQNLARVRPDTVHAMAAVVVSFGVVGAWTRFASESNGRALKRAVALAIGLEIVLALTAATAIGRVPTAGLWSALTVAPDPGRSAGLAAGPSMREAAAFVKAVVPEDQKIFVACGRHDRVFVNEPILYFLAGRLPGSRYHALDPGVATTLPVQEEIVRGFQRHRVEWLIVSTRFDAWNEPNASALSSGVTYLDDYIRSNYGLVRRFPPWIEVLRRTTPWESGAGFEASGVVPRRLASGAREVGSWPTVHVGSRADQASRALAPSAPRSAVSAPSQRPMPVDILDIR